MENSPVVFESNVKYLKIFFKGLNFSPKSFKESFIYGLRLKAFLEVFKAFF